MCIKKSPFPLFQLVVLGQKLHLRKLKLCICLPKCTEQVSNVTSCEIRNNLDRMLKTGPRDYLSLKKLVPRESKKKMKLLDVKMHYWECKLKSEFPNEL